MARGKPSDTDLQIWFRYEILHESLEQIAAQKNKPITQIQNSIDFIQEWKFRNRLSVVESYAMSTIIKNMDGVDKAWQRGLVAEKVIHVDRDTGEVTKMPDVGMQLKAVESIKGFAETFQPKAPGLQLNQQFNGQSGGVSMSSGMSFEAVLRKKREQRGLANEQEIEMEAEVTPEDDLADEFEDFGGTDGDDEEDGEEV